MKVDVFDFSLPEHCIAQEPCRPRDGARLLQVKADGRLIDRTVRDLPDLLRAGDLVVFNDTRVIPARLNGHRHRPAGPIYNGAVFDGPSTGPVFNGPLAGPVIQVTLHKCNTATNWQAFARPGRKLALGDDIIFADDFRARVDKKSEGGEITLQFDCTDEAMQQGLHRHGLMPLPPYIKRHTGGPQEPGAKNTDDTDDTDDYQTVYAEHEGAVAAPTAGLHFTDALLSALDERKIDRAFVTLHVGAGTFLPVKADDTGDHKMHTERGEITAETAERINQTRQSGGRIVAIGTTTLRLLESAADDRGHVHPFRNETGIFITPGYGFRVVDLLMTNFHLPRSTLFMLVSAFAGLQPMHKAYTHAIKQNYRFYSYGDTSLLERL